MALVDIGWHDVTWGEKNGISTWFDIPSFSPGFQHFIFGCASQFPTGSSLYFELVIYVGYTQVFFYMSCWPQTSWHALELLLPRILSNLEITWWLVILQEEFSRCKSSRSSPQQDRPKYGSAGAREPPAPKKDCVWLWTPWLGTVGGRPIQILRMLAGHQSSIPMGLRPPSSWIVVNHPEKKF